VQKTSIIVAVTIVLTLALSTVTLAADPIIGTWKLNIAQWKFSPILQTFLKQFTRKERTENYRVVEENQIELTSNTIFADGSSRVVKAIWPVQGGMVVEEPPPVAAMSYVETMIESGNWYVLRGGKQGMVIHKTISKDGKVMTQTTTGTDPEGRPFEQTEVYDRQ
jgi:hypothetical protein